MKTLSPKTDRLSQLPGNFSLDQCAKCGGCHLLQRWQEHDDLDRPEPKCVCLCKPCADRIIEPHPRLYRQVPDHHFLPGSASVCKGCRWQKHLSCTCPLAMFNGGAEPGLVFDPKPSMALIDSLSYRGPICFEIPPVKTCNGKTHL